MVDLRGDVLTSELRQGLCQHNRVYVTGQAERIYVFANGAVEQIDLT